MYKMKNLSVYISVDMEGIAGVATPSDVWEPGIEYERARILLTDEVNVAIKAAFDFGATEVIVNDAHMYMRNILADRLDERASLIKGVKKLGLMMHGIENAKCDVAFLVGYHAKAGTANGTLCHTFCDQWSELTFNKKIIGETTYSAAYSGCFNCPVGLVTGDSSLSEEINSNIPWAEHVIVKHGIGRFAANTLSPQAAKNLIYNGAQRALEKLEKNELPIYDIEFPIEVAIKFHYTDRAYIASYTPGTTLINPLTVAFDAISIEHLNRTAMTIFHLTN